MYLFYFKLAISSVCRLKFRLSQPLYSITLPVKFFHLTFCSEKTEFKTCQLCHFP